MPHDIITNEVLLEKYLTLPMEQYFYIKNASQERNYVKLKICELLKYLSMSHHVYGDIPVTAEIDDMWHLWILQTIQYQELMEKLPSKKFINHSSNDYVDSKPLISEEDTLNMQMSYLVSYITNFGDFTEENVKFWHFALTLMQSLELSLNGLNKFIKNFIINQNLRPTSAVPA